MDVRLLMKTTRRKSKIGMMYDKLSGCSKARMAGQGSPLHVHGANAGAHTQRRAPAPAIALNLQLACRAAR